MPRVIVIASPSEWERGAMILSERVTGADFESAHFASQLIDRPRRAVGGADQAKQAERVSNGHRRPVARTSEREPALGGRGK